MPQPPQGQAIPVLAPGDRLRPAPARRPGPDNDLAEFLDHHVSRAIADPSVRLYVLGQRWGPEPGRRDKVFGFRPGNGVHDVRT